jgi:hypothetical protein
VKGTSPNVDVTCVTQSPHVDFVEWYASLFKFDNKRATPFISRRCPLGMLVMTPCFVD